MAGQYNIGSINEQIERQTGRAVELSASSLVILQSALDCIGKFYRWNNDGSDIDDDDWNEIQGYLDTAAHELFVEYECEANSVQEIDEFWDDETSGTDGDSTIDGVHTVTFSNTGSLNTGNVSLVSGDEFHPDTGLYFVAGIVASRSQDRGAAYLWNVNEDELALNGVRGYENDARTVSGLVQVTADDYYTLYTENTEAGVQGKPVTSSVCPERYATLTWIRLGD